MSMLQDFPMVNQNTTVTSDGRPSENAQEDCVAATLCAMCMYLNGIKALDHDKYNPDKFKDAAYGEALRNSGTAAVKYIPYCASLGVKLYPVDGDYPTLIKEAHTFLAEGKPVAFTQDDWVVDTSLPEYQGWTHVAAWYADGAGTLTSMDPWGGFPRMKSDAGWANVLRAKEIWVAEKIAAPIPGLPEDWHDDGTTLTAPNGIPVRFGFRSHVLANHWDANNWPLEPERATDQLEGSNPSLGKGSQQTFRWKMLGYTQERGVFEEWTGQELVFARSQIFKYYTLAVQMRDTALKLEVDNAKLQADLQAFQATLPQS